MLISLLFLINNSEITGSIQGITKANPPIETEGTSIKILRTGNKYDIQLFDTNAKIPKLKFRYVYAN
jgi:hypothetical protein